MPPKTKKTATAPTQQTNSKKATPATTASEDAAQQQQHPSKAAVVPPPQTLAKIPSEQTAASFLFGSASTASKATATATTSTASHTFNSLKTQASQLNSIDEVIVNNSNINNNKKNSFLMAVEASLTSNKNSSSSSSPLLFDQVVELLNKFLQQTSSALSANSFMYVLYLLVIASTTTTTSITTATDADEIKLMRALAQMLKTCSMRLELRGSVSDAAKAIFSNTSGTTTTTISSTAFRLCLQLLIAAIENGRHGNVALLSSVLDGIACAQSQNIQPQSLLRDAAQLLTSLGKFATVGSPRLRGLVSAWNAPMLPAKKEAMVVKGSAYKIDVSPEFEVKHVTVKLG